MNTNTRLRHTNCPECKSELTEHRVHHRHSNGYWNEVQKFACGKEIHWSPNFMDVDWAFSKECPNSSKMMEVHNKREKAKEDIVAFISNLDVDDIFIKKIIDAVINRNFC